MAEESAAIGPTNMENWPIDFGTAVEIVGHAMAMNGVLPQGEVIVTHYKHAMFTIEFERSPKFPGRTVKKLSENSSRLETLKAQILDIRPDGDNIIIKARTETAGWIVTVMPGGEIQQAEQKNLNQGSAE